MSINRRKFIAGLGLILIPTGAYAHRGKFKHWHRRRPAARRLIRRRVAWRIVGGRRRLIVPLAVAVGWELVVDDRVTVVREVHTHHIVVEHADGSLQRIDSVKEDTAQNTQTIAG